MLTEIFGIPALELFVQQNYAKSISKDTWMGLLEFDRPRAKRLYTRHQSRRYKLIVMGTIHPSPCVIVMGAMSP